MTLWWRAYSEALHDPKLLALSDRLHRAWFSLLCIAAKNGGVLPAIATVAIELRVTIARAAEYITALVRSGLFDEVSPGVFAPHNWNARQYKSDVTDPTAAQRMRNWRERKRNETVTVTPPREQITDTEAEKKKKEDAPRRARAVKSPLPDDWLPSESPLSSTEGRELEKMRDWARSNAIVKADWDATWRNWLRRAGEQGNQPRGSPTGMIPRPGSREDRQERTANAVSKLTEYINAGADDSRPSGPARQTPSGVIPFAKSS